MMASTLVGLTIAAVLFFGPFIFAWEIAQASKAKRPK
jgi:hypothetical protein